MLNKLIVIKQLDVSKNLIKEKTSQSMRISFLLLDNAAEILMFRYLERETRRFGGSNKKIPYVFADKVKLLIKEKVINQEIGAFICFSHDYRNEIYHRDKLRIETLKPIVLVLFEVVCELFTTLDSGDCFFTSTHEKDLEELYVKYKLPKFPALERDSFNKIVSAIRNELPVSTEEVKKLLIEHLDNRTEDLKGYFSYLFIENK